MYKKAAPDEKSDAALLQVYIKYDVRLLGFAFLNKESNLKELDQ